MPVESIFQGQLERNLRAFLKAKGQDFDLQKTPEYLKEGVALLKKTFGVKMAAYICGQNDTKRFSKWAKGEDLPQTFEAGGLLSAIEITEILLGKLDAKTAKQWMLTPNDYIIGEFPMDFIRLDPDLVRRAALQLFF